MIILGAYLGLKKINQIIVLIRFNPDAFITKNITYKSIFEFSDKFQNLKKTKDFDNRIKLLFKRFDFWLNNKPTKEITIEKLFYNEYESSLS